MFLQTTDETNLSQKMDDVYLHKIGTESEFPKIFWCPGVLGDNML